MNTDLRQLLNVNSFKLNLEYSTVLYLFTRFVCFLFHFMKFSLVLFNKIDSIEV